MASSFQLTTPRLLLLGGRSQSSLRVRSLHTANVATVVELAENHLDLQQNKAQSLAPDRRRVKRNVQTGDHRGSVNKHHAFGPPHVCIPEPGPASRQHTYNIDEGSRLAVLRAEYVFHTADAMSHGHSNNLTVSHSVTDLDHGRDTVQTCFARVSRPLLATEPSHATLDKDTRHPESETVVLEASTSSTAGADASNRPHHSPRKRRAVSHGQGSIARQAMPRQQRGSQQGKEASTTQYPVAQAPVTAAASKPRGSSKHDKPRAQAASGAASAAVMTAALAGAGAAVALTKPAESSAAAAPDDQEQSTARALTQQIKACSTWQQLCSILQQHRSSMNHIHVSAMLVQMSKLQDHSGGRSLVASGNSSGSSTGKVQPPPSKGAVFTTEKVDASPQAKGLQQDVVAAPADVSQQQTSSNDTVHLSRNLQHQPVQSMPTAAEHATAAAAVSVETPPKKRAPITRDQALRMMTSLALSHVSSMSLREVANVMAAVVKLRVAVGKPFAITMMEQAARGFSGGTAQGLAELMWAVERFHMRGLRPDWAKKFYAAVERNLPDFTAQGLVMVLHALACMKQQPPSQWMHGVLDRLAGHAAAGNVSPQDISLTVWALGKLRFEPQQGWLVSLLTSTQGQLGAFSPQELSNTLWGLSRLRHVPPAPWLSAFYAATAAYVADEGQGLNASDQAAAGRWKTQGELEQCLAVVVYSSAVLGVQPGAEWMQRVLHHAAQNFDRFTAQGMAMLVFGCAGLGYHPGSTWLSSFHHIVDAMTGEFHPAALSMIQNAFRTFHHMSSTPGTAAASQQQQQQQKPCLAAGLGGACVGSSPVAMPAARHVEPGYDLLQDVLLEEDEEVQHTSRAMHAPDVQMRPAKLKVQKPSRFAVGEVANVVMLPPEALPQPA